MKGKYDSMNMSNEFQNAHLNDPIPINVAMRNIELSNELAARFVLKDRVIRERDSLGGFRIPQDVLKRRVNPSDEYEQELQNKKSQYTSYQNQTFQNESIDNIANLQGSYQYKMPKKYDMVDIGDINENNSANENLIKMLEAQVNQLKEESQEQLKTLSMQQNKNYGFGLNDQVEEPNVATKFLAANTDRVQAVKHVQTRQKPEYLSLEDLKKEKEVHEKKLLEIENEYYGRKNTQQYNTHTSEKQAQLNKEKKLKALRAIRREGYTEEVPLDPTDQKYIKKYANYLSKKSNNSKLPYMEEWNTTKIKSNNSNGVVNRSDGQTGYIDQEDHTLYYCTINNKAFKRNDFERPLLSNPKRGMDNTLRKTMRNEHQGNRSYDAMKTLYNSYSLFPKNSRSKSPQYASSQNNINQANYNNTNNNNLSVDSSQGNLVNSAAQLGKSSNFNVSSSGNFNRNGNGNTNSQLSFIKMIFSMMDKDNIGTVSKTRIMSEMKLDENTIKELGFDNQLDFQNKLNDYSTESEQVLNEREFISFLLNKGQMNELNTSCHREMFYESQPRVNCHTDQNLSKTKMSQLLYQDIIDNPDDTLPGLKTNTLEFLMHESNKKRLNVLNESLRASGIVKKSKSQNQFGQSSSNYQSQNQNMSFDKNPYSNFVENFPSKADINFTIPQPFDFLKKNYDERKLLKMQEILENRQRKEDAIFNKQFHANSLNSKMFEGNLDNIIEKEKRERKKRTEKLKDEIVNNMKPFSFYAQDEKKYKEKISQECQPPQFQKFKANPIQWKSQVNMYEGLIGNDKQKREALAKERAQATLNAAHLPPRMEMHEKEKKLQEQTKKFIEEQERNKKVKPFTAKEIPNYTLLQEKFITTLEKQKKAAKPTVVDPFTFHEPKKKAELCTYLDNENDPQMKNPQKKPDVQEIIQRLQKKPEIEPATTKGLTLLMETRRKELEAKKKEQERIQHEDKIRQEKQMRYKDKVQAVVKIRESDKTKKDKTANENAKQAEKAKAKEYQERLQRINQRVANRPLLLEAGMDTQKIAMNQTKKNEIDEIVQSEIQMSQAMQNEVENKNIISSINNATQKELKKEPISG